MRTKYLIIGLGSIGARHVRNLVKLDKSATFEILRSSRKKNARLEELQQEFPGKITVSFDLARSARKKPDVCLICNPPALHVSTALSVIPFCKNILIEKPLSHNMTQVDKLISAAQKQRAVIMVGYCLRFHPVVKKAKKIVDSGQLGKIMFLRAEVGSYLPAWRKGVDYTRNYSAKKELGGGVILDLSHEIDYCYWLAGAPREITCSAAKVSDLDIDTEDLAEILLTYNSGAHCSIHLDYLQREPIRTLKILFTKGQLSADLISKKIEITRVQKDLLKKEFLDLNREDSDDMYIAELQHFLECIKRNKQPLISLEEGKAVLGICMKAKQSADLKKTVNL
ncbi:MAG: Gfo/Idh/MocA family oxidoreductase [Nanoarchaeota archaeon]